MSKVEQYFTKHPGNFEATILFFQAILKYISKYKFLYNLYIDFKIYIFIINNYILIYTYIHNNLIFTTFFLQKMLYFFFKLYFFTKLYLFF